jgi:hypothetical protein
MGRQRRVLEEAGRALRLPQAVRARVLAEVAADADALYAHYRAQGDDAFTALRKVEQRLGVTSDVAAELGELYEPAWVRVLRRFAPGRAHIVERVLLVTTLFFLSVTGARAMAAFRLLDGSVFPWLVLVLGVACLVNVLIRVFRIFVKLEDSPASLRAGLDGLWVLAAVVLLVALSGAVTMLWALLGKANAAADSGVLLMTWVRQSSDLVTAGLATASFAVLVWFMVMGRADAAERKEHELLVERHTWSIS